MVDIDYLCQNLTNEEHDKILHLCEKMSDDAWSFVRNDEGSGIHAMEFLETCIAVGLVDSPPPRVIRFACLDHAQSIWDRIVKYCKFLSENTNSTFESNCELALYGLELVTSPSFRNAVVCAGEIGSVGEVHHGK